MSWQYNVSVEYAEYDFSITISAPFLRLVFIAVGMPVVTRQRSMHRRLSCCHLNCLYFGLIALSFG
jgi:hypothetical protein